MIKQDTFGKPMIDGQESTWFTPHFTLGYGPDTGLTEKEIMPMNELPKQYQNGSWWSSSAKQNNYLKGMKVLPNMTLKAVGSEDDQSTLMYFFNHSYLLFEINSKVYDPLILSLFVPFDIVYDGGYAVKNKNQDFFLFKNPIPVPEGNFKMTFVPASGLTTAASGATNPQLPNLGYSSNYAFWLKFLFLGSAERNVA